MKSRRPPLRLAGPALLPAMALCASLAHGHPHVFVETALTFVFDEAGLKEIVSEWRYDASITADFVAHFDRDGDGRLGEAEADELARTLAEELRETGFYTVLKVDGERVAIERVEDARASLSVRRLWLSFAIPCRVEVRDGVGEVRIAQFDPEYFIAFSPSNASRHVLDDGRTEIGFERFVDTTESYYRGMMNPDYLILRFRRRTVGDAGAGEKPDSPYADGPSPTPLEDRSIANGGRASPVASEALSLAGDDRRGPAPVPSEAEPGRIGWLGRVTDWQLALRERLDAMLAPERYRRLTPLSVLVMCAFAFVYGAIHAAGPGHGKVVAATWLAGGDHSAASGVLLGVLVACFHGLSGVLVVALGRLVFERTAMAALGGADKPLRILSFALIAGIGAVMFALEIRARRRRRRQGVAPDRNAVSAMDVSSGAGAGMGRGDEPERPSSSGAACARRSGRSLLLLAAAAGVIPCPGVALVMLFASAVGRVGVGLLLAFCVILGMALTIGMVGALAAMARRSAFARRRGGFFPGDAVESVLRLAGAAAVCLVGCLFLATTLWS